MYYIQIKKNLRIKLEIKKLQLHIASKSLL